MPFGACICFIQTYGAAVCANLCYHTQIANALPLYSSVRLATSIHFLFESDGVLGALDTSLFATMDSKIVSKPFSPAFVVPRFCVRLARRRLFTLTVSCGLLRRPGQRMLFFPPSHYGHPALQRASLYAPLWSMHLLDSPSGRCMGYFTQ